MRQEDVGASNRAGDSASDRAIDMSRLMRPRSVAIVGISPEPRSAGFLALRNLEEFDYRGAIHLVSRNQRQVGGRTCVRAIDDLPDGVDAAMLFIPRVAIEDAVAACVRRGIGGVVIFAAGFAEAGGEWLATQDRIAAIARAAGMALCGPNCLGIIDFAHGIPLTFARQIGRGGAVASGVAVIAQSGGLAGVVRSALAGRGIAVTCTVSTGNEAVLGLEDYAAYLLEDPATKVVVAFAEQIRRPQAFLAMASRARALGKPVVLLMSGHSAAARESAKSHTGALAGDYEVIATLLRHHSIILVQSLEELFDVAELTLRFPEPPTRGLAMVTDSGAVKGLAFDCCEALGLDLPPLPPGLAAQIQAQLPDFVGASNPLDLTAQAITHPQMYERTIKPLLADDSYGSLLLAVIIGEVSETALAKGRVCLRPLVGSRKPAIIGLLGDDVNLPSSIITDARAAGIPFFRSPERALRALARVTAYGRSLEKARTRSATPALDAPPLPAHGTLTEHASKRYIAGLGIAVPQGGLAGDLTVARTIAARIGYPVALKLQASALPHKSDAGAVLLGIGDDAQLAVAWDKLAQVASRHPGLAVDGVLVEAMAPSGLEMIVGARRESDWGPVVLVGLGGIWTEALHDVRVLPVGLGLDEITQEIGRLKGARLLQGMRGAPARDLTALAATVQLIGSLMAARPDIREIDLNPLTVYGVGEGVLALDALIVEQA
jgi:acyl-CoA synthetase (NDP forming)